ncbi:MAG: hypothetical protein LBL07_10400 [Tannerella sp.]|jgi:hypothetical protein|nr:hypothetical protein [Tannerella sp.]
MIEKTKKTGAQTVEEFMQKNKSEIEELGKRITDMMENGGINVLKFEAGYTAERKIQINFEAKK